MRIKAINVFLLICMTSLIASSFLYAQDRVLKDERSKICLKYKDKQLRRIDYNKEKYNMNWSKGEVKILYQKIENRYITETHELTFRFDRLFRIFEGLEILEYGNHYYDTYIAYKYGKSGSEPVKCYFHDYCSNPYRVEELIDECEHKILFQSIIKHELTSRSKYYIKGKKNINVEDYNMMGLEMSIDLESNYMKWLLFDKD
jgi:hypothetical protein